MLELAPKAVLSGTYELIAMLGQGGMGEVWRAQHLRIPKQVAIKVLAPAAQKNSEAVARFRREAEIATRLGHPNIVEIMDFNELDDGRYYIAMELLHGEDLRHALSRGRMPLGEALRLLRQVASALSVAHQAGVIHRDLKPENIFLAHPPALPNEPPTAKILDFGISKIQGADTQLTGTHAVIGTPAYMSPEQASGKNDLIDARTDQFSLAAMAYEMFGGVCPYSGATLTEVIYKVVFESAPPLNEIRSDLPASLVKAIDRAMSKQPHMRFPDVSSFIRALSGDEAVGQGQSAGEAIGSSATILGPSAGNVGLAGTQLGPNADNVGLAGTQLGPNADNVGLAGTQLGPNADNVGLAGTQLGPNADNVGLAGTQLGSTSGQAGIAATQLGPGSVPGENVADLAPTGIQGDAGALLAQGTGSSGQGFTPSPAAGPGGAGTSEPGAVFPGAVTGSLGQPPKMKRSLLVIVALVLLVAGASAMVLLKKDSKQPQVALAAPDAGLQDPGTASAQSSASPNTEAKADAFAVSKGSVDSGQDVAKKTLVPRSHKKRKISRKEKGERTQLSPEAQRRLELARQAFQKGDYADAWWKANQSLQSQPLNNIEALIIMAKSKCGQLDLGGANGVLRRIPRRKRPAVWRYCKKFGLTLSP